MPGILFAFVAVLLALFVEELWYWIKDLCRPSWENRVKPSWDRITSYFTRDEHDDVPGPGPDPPAVNPPPAAPAADMNGDNNVINSPRRRFQAFRSARHRKTRQRDPEDGGIALNQMNGQAG